jgi:RimJ/RimL family protein N-acetyltransferase
VALVKMTIPWFFEKMKLQKLYCEPYALNPAPSKVLERAGFTFVKEHVCTPGSINFEQRVKRWEMSYDNLKKMKPADE